MKILSARTAVALPAALSLALGGALLAAGPASAADAAALTVTTPDGTSSVVTTPVAFEGNGLPDGDTLSVTYRGGADGTTTETATVTGLTDTAGAWSASVGFPDTAPGQTTVTYVAQAFNTGVADGAPVTQSFTFATAPVAPLPAATLTANPTLETIEQATTTGLALAGTNFGDSEPVTVTIVGPHQTTVTPVAPPAAAADASGDYATTLALPADASAGTYSVTATGTTTGQTATAELSVLGDPTITSPVDGQKIVGTSISITGTATPGSSVLVFLDTTADFDKEVTGASTATARMRAAAADGTQMTPAADTTQSDVKPLLVGDDGTWKVGATGVPAGDYTFIVFSFVDDGTGEPVTNAAGPVLTGAGPVEFTLVAPAATTTASTTSAATGDPTLAFTGSEDSVPALIGGGLLLLAGAGLMVVARRRRSSFEG